jgi:proline dehydrogenase
MLSHEQIRFSNALKSIARNQDIKRYIQDSQQLYPLFMLAANRFVSGEKNKKELAKQKS